MVVKTTATLQYPSLVQGLADYWITSLVALGYWQKKTPLPLFKIVLNPLGTVATPLPLQLASQNPGKTAQEWGTLLIADLKPSRQSLPDPPDYWIHPQGWLYVSWPARSLAAWLQSLLSARPQLSEIPLQKPSSHLFPQDSMGISLDPVLFQLQYAHARCWSVLRLAQAQDLLPPFLEGSPLQWHESSLWLTEAGQWRSQTASEQALLRSLLAFPQSLSPQKGMDGRESSTDASWMGTETQLSWPIPTPHLYRQAKLWGTQFLDFYRECRFFGEIQQTAPEVQQMRLALLFIVQRVLAFLLEKGFALRAPQEL